MVETTKFSLISIKNELLNRLRTHFISKDPNIRIVLKTKSFTGDGENKIFNISSTLLSCVDYVEVDGEKILFGKDYEIIWRGNNRGSVELKVAPDNGDSIIVSYGEKKLTGNFVYGDFPRSDLGESNYPRIGFKLTDNPSRIGGDGRESVAYNHEMLLQIKVVDSDIYQIDTLINELNDFFMVYFKSFYYFPYIDPSSISEYDDYSDGTEKNNSKYIEFNIPYKYDIRQVN